MSLRLEHLSKRFGAVVAVDDVSLQLAGSGTLALLGPSGCGKSTLLRLVAGLERPDRGKVVQAGRDISSLPPQEREMGMVFQDYALFPHLDVAANVAFSLVEAKRPAGEIDRRTAELLELVGMAGLQRRRTFELSGGQQQRVALARALAAEPSLLLLDEPLSNLDPELRSTLQLELRELLGGLTVQSLYVTHDQAEAFAVAPRVALMRSGRIVQEGVSEEVLARPSGTWAARFLGYRNVFRSADLAVARGGNGAVLVRDELIRPGGGVETRVAAVERLAHRLRLTLIVPSWGVDLVWEGFERELPDEPAVGDRLDFEVPEAAWVELEQS